MTAVLAIQPSGARPRRVTPARIGIYAFLLITALFFLAPLYVMVVTSLKSMEEIRLGTILAPPHAPTLQPWLTAWFSACTGLRCNGISVGFVNSVKILIPSVIVSIAVGSLTGYTLSFWRVRGAGLLFGTLMVIAFVPYQIFIYPLVRVFSFVGLNNSISGIVVVHTIFGLPTMTLLFRNYFAALPPELFKAARIDGAGFFRIFWSVMLPMATPMLIVAVILQVTGIWNDFILGLVFAGRENLPMTVQLNNIVNSTQGERAYNVDMAAAMLTALVPLVDLFRLRALVRARHRRRRGEGLTMVKRCDVSIRGAEIAYGAVTVLEKFDLEVAQAEFIVLLGPSGCGKSTLLNAIAGLVELRDGQIWIGGNNVTWEEPKDRGIAMVFQSYALYPRMTRAREHVLRLEGCRRAAGRRSTRRVDARGEDAANHRAAGPAAGRTFGRPAPARRDRPRAGARCRRLSVRRAAVQPRRQAARRNAGRDQAAAPAARGDDDLCHARPDRGDDTGDRIAVMKDRVIQQLGTPDEIYRRPANRFVASLCRLAGDEFLARHLCDDCRCTLLCRRRHIHSARSLCLRYATRGGRVH